MKTELGLSCDNCRKEYCTSTCICFFCRDNKCDKCNNIGVVLKYFFLVVNRIIVLFVRAINSLQNLKEKAIRKKIEKNI